jgi:hypothetical protein
MDLKEIIRNGSSHAPFASTFFRPIADFIWRMATDISE